MGFFNDLSKKTTEATNKITREAKLRVKMAENKNNINEIYKLIGKKVYESHVRKEKIDVEEDCKKIDELSKEIEDARVELLTLNNKKMCTKCYAEIDKEAKFCPKCGEEQTAEKTVLEKAEETLEKTEVSKEKQNEKEIVQEELQENNKKEE